MNTNNTKRNTEINDKDKFEIKSIHRDKVMVYQIPGDESDIMLM